MRRPRKVIQAVFQTQRGAPLRPLHRVLQQAPAMLIFRAQALLQ